MTTRKAVKLIFVVLVIIGLNSWWIYNDEATRTSPFLLVLSNFLVFGIPFALGYGDSIRKWFNE